ncbi:uncharacterized protein N7479_004369 [Penicillium vulpinum]|uniref:Uncharacterized protein n=1 Tax=Penicillium vulpinum TaxID=29845 RepID=A0A1V6SC77_9EURO|nr:uncharacterized protein N7479_004369 [Penicillium vulpinum]KAJ5964493.1 hypothetical protein N7479_004369 [Penicillium vulpinum]OQE11615.1 hypothetical protein PENVUL_c002G01861 [Penicillium vulpinum]
MTVENQKTITHNYIDIPIIDIFVEFVENNSNYENSVKSMLSGILTYYFPANMGYVVGPKPNRNNKHFHFLISRLQRHFSGDQGIFDFALVKAKRPTDTSEESLEQLTEALEDSNTEHGRFWAILAVDKHLEFYEYYRDLPKNENLLPWCPPCQFTNSFHIRHNCEVIDWVFNYMRQNGVASAR